MLRITDDFSDEATDGRIWYVLGRENGAVFVERDGRVEIAVVPGAVPNEEWNQVGGHYGTRCQFPGDFDARVDFQLLEWPEQTGVHAGLSAYFVNAAIVRVSNYAGDSYSSWIANTAMSAHLPHRDGRLRMKRLNGVITTYFWHNGAWRRLTSARSRGLATLGIQAQANGDQFAHKQVRVAFDNFVVTAPEAYCPPGSDPRGT